MAKVIFHIDLNSFYASAEIVRNTALDDQPVVVAGLSRRSVVTTASYEARKYGVHSAMPLHQALTLCPNLIVVEGDFGWYKELSKRFFDYIRQFSPFVEPASIDECYVDMSEKIKQYERPLDLAWEIQQGLLKELRLPCSIGVGPNRFLAKMASDMRKPLGITVLRKQEIARKLWPMDIGNMHGVGKKTTAVLKEKGILTIGDFADEKNSDTILQLLGKNSYSFIQNSRGQGSDVLSFNNTIQSISQSTTLDHDISDYDEIKTIFTRLCKSLMTRIEAHHAKGSLISISIRYHDFKTIARSVSLPNYTDSYSLILENVMFLFDREHNDIPIRHLGISLGSLFSAEKNVDQISMFDLPTQAKNPKDKILEELNRNIEGTKLTFASNIKK